MKRVVLILLIIMSGVFISEAQTPKESTVKHYFALSLQPGPEDLITFAIISISEDGERTNTYLSRRSFIRQIIGMEYSIANPTETNILKDAGIDGPEVFDNIWKLRYAENPYKSADSSDAGWAKNKFRPSEGQLGMLSAFGIKTLSDFSYGDQLIELFKAMNNDSWVADYYSK
jgi:hypothetical protein